MGAPHPVDIHVGTRVRIRRETLGLKRDHLSDLLGIGLQQVQRYESGTTRISASSLLILSAYLDTPVSFFFDEMPLDIVRQWPAKHHPIDPPAQLGVTELLNSMAVIKDENVRKSLINLLRSISEAAERKPSIVNAEVPESTVAAPKSVAAFSQQERVVLVVEDDKDLRTLATKIVSSLGYHTLAASDGPAALAIMNGGAAIDVLFTDIVLPLGMSGMALATKARKQFGSLRVLFTSGYPGMEDRVVGKESAYLEKPYRRHDVAAHLQQLLECK